MKAAKKPQLASVEQLFGMEPPQVHCSICGKTLFPDMENIEGVEACEHLAFVFYGIAGEYGHKSSAFEAKFQPVEDDFDSSESVTALAQAGYKNELLVLEITYGGMGHGPSCYTDLYGFDFSIERTSDQEDQ